MKDSKKVYKSPEIFDLSFTQTIGACLAGDGVVDCQTGALYQSSIECKVGSSARQLTCNNGSGAWRK